MTTIAYRDGVLAGDSRTTMGGMVMTNGKKKVFRFRDGTLFGYSGDQEQGERLRAAIKAGTAAPKLDNISALMVLTTGKIMLYEGQAWVGVDAEYTSVGSGCPHALTAMDCGKTAAEAVRMAIKRDPLSGGKVTTVELKK